MTPTYFIDWKGKRDGPYSVAQITALLERGDIGVLHRVETAAGLVPLKQFLVEADGARWGHLKGPKPATTAGVPAGESSAPASGYGMPPPNEATVTPIPLLPPSRPDAAETAYMLFPGHHSVHSIPTREETEEAAREETTHTTPTFSDTPSRVSRPLPRPRPPAKAFGETSDVLEAYAKSGLCFLFPPYIFWSWKSAVELHHRGYLLAADRVRWISLGLAAGGMVFWLFLWLAW